ncbi:hypothetical protein Tco_1426117 [Tanacetum coccineum]
MNTLYPLSVQKVNNFHNLVLSSLNFVDMALPPREQRHRCLGSKGLEYSDADIADFEARLARIYRREARSARQILDKGDKKDYWMGISSAGDFLGTAPSHTAIQDPILRLFHRLIDYSISGRSQAPEKVSMTDLFYLRGMDVNWVNVTYLLARYLRLFAAGRKSMAHISGGQFVAQLAEHFGLLTAEILGGLTVITPELPIIDMAKLVRLKIYVEIDDTWAWVTMGPERQPDAAAGAPIIAKDAPAVDEGRLEEDVQGLHRDVGSLRGLVERSMTDQGRFSTWMMTCMTQLMDASGLTYQAFDGTF